MLCQAIDTQKFGNIDIGGSEMRLMIKEYREELQLTQKQLAEKINNLQRNVSNWEKGTSEPDCDTIVKLADIFDISIDELYGRQTSVINKNQSTGVEINIMKYVRMLSDTQKFALLQFLKEINNKI